MHVVSSPFAKDAPARARQVVLGLPLLPHRDRIVPGGNLVYVEGYKTRFKPKGAAAQATLLEGFERLRGDPTQKAATLYLLDLDPEKALALWNDLSMEFILDDFATRMVIGVYGLPALPGALGRVAKAPGDVLEGLARADVLAVAPVMAHALGSKKEGKDDAEHWLISWSRTAAIALIPVAVGALGVARDEAESALRFLDKRGHGGVLREVGASYGPEAAASLDEVLAAFELPKEPPKLPDWALSSALPELCDHDGAAVDAASTETLLQLLVAFSPELISFFVPFEEPDEGEVSVGRNVARHVARFHPEVTRAKEALSEASRDAFVEALYAAWMGQGGSAKDKWALFASSALGGDAAAVRMHEGVLSSHREKKHARARLIVDALALHGSSRSVAALSAIAVQKGLKETASTAEALLAEAARQLDAGPDDLADVATANPAARLTLGAGMTVALEADLRLVVQGEGGARMPAPQPAKAWKEANEEAKRAFLDAAVRFERGMVERRRMSESHFRSVVLANPVLAELARRLVFAVHDGATERPRVVAHVETTELVDRSGRKVSLAAGETLSVVHPALLDEAERARWGDTISELRILQPFPQLGRPVFVLEERERGRASLDRFDGKTVPTGSLLGLARLGWRPSVDDRAVLGCTRVFGDVHVRLAFAPGYDVGRPDAKQLQTLGLVTIARIDAGFVRPGSLDAVDRVVFSEIVREVSTLLVG